MTKAVLFTGISGIRKKEFLLQLRERILRSRHQFRRMSSTDFSVKAKSIMPIVELFAARPETHRGNFFAFEQTLSKSEENAKRALNMLANSDEVELALIHTHASYYMLSHFKSWISRSGIQQLFDGLEVTRILHIIDNVYSTMNALGESGMSAQQLLAWRDVEQMMTEVLAGRLSPDAGVYDFVKVVAAKHPPDVFERLVTNSSFDQLYLAFPIAKYRRWVAEGNLSMAERYLRQNSEFREYFSERFVSYDPSRIDEVPLQIAAQLPSGSADAELTEYVSVGERDIWPSIVGQDTLLMGSERFPIEILRSLLGGLGVADTSDDEGRKTMIERHVRSRDLRLIDQSDAVVVYRPTIGGEWSKSVRAEVDYAIYRTIPFYIIKDREDGPISFKATLGAEFDRASCGEWNLDDPAQRLAAFSAAEQSLKGQIKKNKDDALSY